MKRSLLATAMLMAASSGAVAAAEAQTNAALMAMPASAGRRQRSSVTSRGCGGNARCRRAAAKKRNQARNRKAQR